MKKVLPLTVTIILFVTGCVSPNAVLNPANKPDYQLIDPEEQARRHQSCREDPYQAMCQPPGP